MNLTPEQRKRYLFGDFTLTERDRRIYELAKQYHEQTEAYDQKVCSGRNERGVAMPVDNQELAMINRNALAIRKRLLKENPDICGKELNRAIQRF